MIAFSGRDRGARCPARTPAGACINTQGASALICLHANMQPDPVRFITEEQVRERLRPADAIAVIEAAFRDRLRSTLIPVRTQMNLAAGVFLVMPCYDGAGEALGIK